VGSTPPTPVREHPVCGRRCRPPRRSPRRHLYERGGRREGAGQEQEEGCTRRDTDSSYSSRGCMCMYVYIPLGCWAHRRGGHISRQLGSPPHLVVVLVHQQRGGVGWLVPGCVLVWAGLSHFFEMPLPVVPEDSPYGMASFFGRYAMAPWSFFSLEGGVGIEPVSRPSITGMIPAGLG
jgi:hypothetical protein